MKSQEVARIPSQRMSSMTSCEPGRAAGVGEGCAVVDGLPGGGAFCRFVFAGAVGTLTGGGISNCAWAGIQAEPRHSAVNSVNRWEMRVFIEGGYGS
jgi:hypothetical protein